MMKPRLRIHFQPLAVVLLATGGFSPHTVAQPQAQLAVRTYAGLTITGAVGTVYSVEYATDLAQTNNPSAWHCLEYSQLPASPYLWVDKSAPATGRRFYRAVAMEAPTNMVFIPHRIFGVLFWTQRLWTATIKPSVKKQIPIIFRPRLAAQGTPPPALIVSASLPLHVAAGHRFSKFFNFFGTFRGRIPFGLDERPQFGPVL